MRTIHEQGKVLAAVVFELVHRANDAAYDCAWHGG
jgi:hypothetical protein